MKAVLSIILWIVALAPAMSAAGPAPAKAPLTPAWAPNPANQLFACPTRVDQIGRIVAPVMIDGKGPFRFVVDTGANHSMISQHLAQVLGLTRVGHDVMRVMGITGTQELPWVTVSRLQVGSMVMRDLRLPVTQSRVMVGADGILGAAGLSGDRLTVDFKHNQVFVTRSHGGPIWDFLRIRARRTAGGLLVIPAHIGRIAVEAIVDTGSPRTLGNAALRKALLATFPKGSVRPKIYGVTKEVSSGNLALSPTIALGPVKINYLSIVYSDIPIFKVWHLESKPALVLGMDVLGTVDGLVLDFAHPAVYLLPVEGPGVDILDVTDSMY